jgi:hypothetical protein
MFAPDLPQSMKKAIILSLLIALCTTVFAQNGKQQYKVAIISFYNLENLYDTTDNPIVDDEEFLPKGIRNYGTAVYKDKLDKLASVLAKIGTDMNPDGPAIIGVAEIENDTVLTDLANHPLLKKRGYRHVHYDSRDARGVDVGMFYNPKYFTPEQSDKLFVKLPGGSKDAYFTRDVLWVKGRLDGETIHVYVNHWPSRRGGEERSAPAREAAALVCKRHIDSIMQVDGSSKIVLMGDLNDDPVSPSVAVVLEAKGKMAEVKKGGLFNPWMELYKNGIGTLAYQDSWNLFDQIIISQPWLSREQKGFFYYGQRIFNPEFMTENMGRYKGYPMRTWDGNTYRGGYSDHFPTYLIFLKKLEKDGLVSGN